MKPLRIIPLLVILLAAVPVASEAAGHYALAFWRTTGNDEGHGIAVMAVHVFNELGQPVPGVTVRFDGSLTSQTGITDYRGYTEYGFQFTGSPASVSCADGMGSTSDSTPLLYNHDTHRMYEIGFMYKSDASNPGTFDTSACGDLTQMSQAACTNSLTFHTPRCDDYFSDTRTLSANSCWEFGNTFVANADRAIAMRAHLTKGFGTRFRWTAQILEGGPDGPPMGPKKILRNEYIEGDNKYLLNYTPDECALKPGNTYYVAFGTADASDVNTYEVNDVYPYGTLYENQVPVSGKDLQAWVCAMSSGNSNVGTVTGSVKDSQGQPVAEALVTLSPGSKEIRTGKAGTYRCYNVPPGAYTMTASAPGCQPATVADRTVSVGGTLTTDFTLQKAPGPISILSTTGGSIKPGDAGIPISMTVSNTGNGDLEITSAGLTFLEGGSDVSNYFTVTPSPSNPTFVRGNSTAVFDFAVDSQPQTPAGDITVQGRVEANVNLQANGSFEYDSYLPDYTGPSGWAWYSDDPPSVARLSYQHTNRYELTDAIPLNTDLIRVRWIAKWSTPGSDLKQGLRVYWPNPAGGQWRTQLNIYCRSHDMHIGNYGSGDSTYYFTGDRYYQIDAWYRASDGKSQFTITPLQEPGKPVGVINGTASTSTSTGGAFKWGCMTDSGTDEMSCREVSYWCESGGSVIQERQWVAATAYPHPPTDPGQGYTLDSGSTSGQAMLPGAPWSADTHFYINGTDKREGADALDVWFSPSGSNKQLYLSTSQIPVEPCTTYTASFWYKTMDYGGSGYDLKLLWEEYDAASTPYFQAVGDPPFHFSEPEIKTAGGWRHVTYRFTTTQWTRSCEARLQLLKPGTDAAAALVRFDDFRLTGPNSWADEDVESPGTLTVQSAAVQCDSIAEAKALEDGTVVGITDTAVTGYPVDDSVRFYIEESDRSSGIVVDKTGGSGDLAVVDGELVSLTATLATVNGERVLTYPDVTSRVAGAAPRPLALNARALGGGPEGYTPGVDAGLGLNNVGLLVTVCGRISSTGSGFFYVDDGSGVTGAEASGVKVISGNIPQQSGATFAVVTGFSSVEKVGTTYHRVVRPRRQSDIVWF